MAVAAVGIAVGAVHHLSDDSTDRRYAMESEKSVKSTIIIIIDGCTIARRRKYI